MEAWEHWYLKCLEKLPKELEEEQSGQPMFVQHTSIYTEQLFHELLWFNLQVQRGVHFY